MRAASRERMKVVPSITSLREDMNRRHDCRICSQFVGFIVASGPVVRADQRGIAGRTPTAGFLQASSINCESENRLLLIRSGFHNATDDSAGQLLGHAAMTDVVHV
jgi:hypothetical protein